MLVSHLNILQGASEGALCLVTILLKSFVGVSEVELYIDKPCADRNFGVHGLNLNVCIGETIHLVPRHSLGYTSFRIQSWIVECSGVTFYTVAVF